MAASRSRVRRVIKWGGCSICLLLLLLWPASRWAHLEINLGHALDGIHVSIAAGALDVDYANSEPGIPRHVQVQLISESWVRLVDWQWWPDWRRGTLSWPGVLLTYAGLTIPLWIPFLLVAMPTTYHLLRDRRAEHRALTQLCPRCSYCLSNLPPQSPCPECGGAYDAESIRRSGGLLLGKAEDPSTPDGR